MVPPLLLLFLNWALGHSPIPAPREQSQLLEEGRKQHEKLQQLSLLPSYGQCWSQALAKLHRGCRELDQEQQSRMALDFTHCHLDRSGKSFPPCTESSSLRECTQDMDPVAFGAYTEFFTHTYSICYYLQSELWQQQAEYTINRLTVTSDSVARQLEVTNQMAQEMLNAQNATLRGQEEILRNGDTLKLTLQQSTQGVQRVFREMQDSTQEQQRVFSEIFHRLSYLHQFVMIESTTFYSFTYNLMAFLVAFLVTSTQRTAAARLVLYILICLSVLLERTIYSSVLGPSESSFEYAERVYFRVWLLRKLVALTGLLVLAYSFVTYQDVGRQSLELLRGVRETQCQLQRAIEEAAPLLSPAPTRWREGRTKICQIDLGIGDVKLPKEEPQPSAELAVLPSRTPRKTKPPPRSPSRSATRRHSARRSEVSVYNILVSESPSKYNLRQRKSSGSVAGT